MRMVKAGSFWHLIDAMGVVVASGDYHEVKFYMTN